MTSPGGHLDFHPRGNVWEACNMCSFNVFYPITICHAENQKVSMESSYFSAYFCTQNKVLFRENFRDILYGMVRSPDLLFV